MLEEEMLGRKSCRL